jgi:hypothetical protein
MNMINITVKSTTYRCAPMSAMDEYAITQKIESPLMMGLRHNPTALDDQGKIKASDIKTIIRVLDPESTAFIYQKMFEWGVFSGQDRLDMESFQGKTGDLRELVAQYIFLAFGNFISGLEDDIFNNEDE